MQDPETNLCLTHILIKTFSFFNLVTLAWDTLLFKCYYLGSFASLVAAFPTQGFFHYFPLVVPSVQLTVGVLAQAKLQMAKHVLCKLMLPPLIPAAFMVAVTLETFASISWYRQSCSYLNLWYKGLLYDFWKFAALRKLIYLMMQPKKLPLCVSKLLWLTSFKSQNQYVIDDLKSKYFAVVFCRYLVTSVLKTKLTKIKVCKRGCS